MDRKKVVRGAIRGILPYLLILMVSFIILLKPFGDCDELWNYNFARNILKGNIPYRDFSIVQTPLSCYVSALLMLILGDGLFAFKVITYILFVCISSLIFHLCKSATNNTGVALGATAIAMSAHFLRFIYNYNYLSTLALLIIFEIEYKEKRSLKNNLLIGLLVGITLLVKQNTGLLIWIANIVICYRAYRKNTGDKNIYIFRFLVSNIPMVIYSGYLMIVGAFDDFIEYAVIGISTFTHRYSLIDFCLNSPFFITYLVLIIVMYALIVKKTIGTQINDYQFAVLVFAVAWIFIIYPLADVNHVLLLLIPLIPGFCGFYKFKKIKHKEIVCTLVISVFCFQLMLAFTVPINVDFNMSKLNNYKGVLIDSQIEKSIEAVDEYILQKEKDGYRVRIADPYSVAFTIPINHYEKNWDMLLVGNIGTYTVQELLETDKPTLYLVIKNGSAHDLQKHYELLDYIKDNYIRVDAIKGFYVYESKE